MTHQANPRIMLGVSLLLLVMAGLVRAATITVGPGADHDFDSVQAGIDDSVEGDTVLVASGEYVITEPISFRGKAITVKSETGPDETTIRMGTPADPDRASVVIFESNETTESILEGFTITGGKGFLDASQNEWVGGGIFFDASSGTVRNCAVMQNTAMHGGGVLCAYPCSPNLIDCTIAGNSAELAFGGGVFVYSGSSLSMTNCIVVENSSIRSGGGVFAWSRASLTLTNCIITKNSSAQTAGGGVMCGDNSLATLTNCIISENSAARHGGVMCEERSSMTLSNCTIAKNSTDIMDGGVFCGVNSSMIMTNCTITENSAGSGYRAVLCWEDSSLTVTNSIVWGNTAPQGGQIMVEEGGTITISYSDITGGQAAALTDSDSTLNWGEGNIDVDPLFADPNKDDFHLKSEVGCWDAVSENWAVDDVTSSCIDAGDPNSPVGDEPEPNGGRINLGAYGGTAEASMSPFGAQEIVYIQWLGHSTVKVWTEDMIVYVDPEGVPETLHDADLVCVTHTHGDHYSPSDIAKVSNAQTQFVGPPDVVQRYGSGQTIAPGQVIEFDFVNVKAVPAYNTNKSNHPKSNNWVGYILELGGKRIYVAGDTDLIEEMRSLGDIDAAILPAGGTYTMNAVEAAEATQYIKPKLAIPYHWGQIVGTLADAQRFAELARCAVKILAVNETIASDEWPEYQPLVAHWALDETEGDIAYDSAGEHHCGLFGNPIWQPVGGEIAGALQFDGEDDYASTPFVLDPAEGVFSVFAWIKGGAAGQVFLSQEDGTGLGETWLGVNPVGGYLVSGLVPPPAGRTVTPALESQFIITDGQWHHVGFIWDGRYRHLYADGMEVAVDTGPIDPLTSSNGGMFIGVGKSLEASSYFSGLIDDVRIYDQALDEQEVKALAR